MATSESDDFESADEELGNEPTRRPSRRNWSSPTAIDSESDDDTECLSPSYEDQDKRSNIREAQRPALVDKKNDRADKPSRNTRTRITDHPANQSDKAAPETVERQPVTAVLDEGRAQSNDQSLTDQPDQSQSRNQDGNEGDNSDKKQMIAVKESNLEAVEHSECKAKDRARVRPQRRPEGSRSLGAKKLGTRIVATGDGKPTVEGDLSEKLEQLSMGPEQEERILVRFQAEGEDERCLMNELAEPEELKSDKKFNEVFDPQGWEGLGSDIELPDELTEEKLQPVLERLSSAGQDSENASGWGSWGSWGVSTLLNTATAGVSTLTSHVSHGLTLLEESIGTPDSTDSDKTKEESSTVDDKGSDPQESPSMTSFGFGNLISGVSSITKLVESTSSKVMSGGLDTLEAIGKKTMEVLQEGDPGLKKKRAFFINESDKPNLSQVLREAKEKADATEKTYEEKQWARKIHFESLFDDYQGLVHLEALEMLSKQSSMKIQQHLINLSGDELTSIQETLEDVKELCDPTDEDDGEEESNEKDLRLRLQDACSDLGIDIAYDKLCTVWDESQKYLEPPVEQTDQEIFQAAISALAQFTAFSIERFHKTAELILIKPRRSTVNEADALVQLTRILSNQIGLLASCYCNTLNEAAKQLDKSDHINANITTVFLEATNASSYVQDAFRLLIPIVQVGAI